MFLTALRRFDRRNTIFIIGAATALLVVGSFATPSIVPTLLGLIGKDPEMSGRLPLWKIGP
jgi:hypothetical protein